MALAGEGIGKTQGMTEEDFNLEVKQVSDSTAFAILMVDAAKRALTNLRGSLRQIEREHKVNVEKEQKAAEARDAAALGFPVPQS